MNLILLFNRLYNSDSTKHQEAVTRGKGVREKYLLHSSRVSTIGHQAKSAQGQGDSPTHDARTASTPDAWSLLAKARTGTERDEARRDDRKRNSL